MKFFLTQQNNALINSLQNIFSISNSFRIRSKRELYVSRKINLKFFYNFFSQDCQSFMFTFY